MSPTAKSPSADTVTFFAGPADLRAWFKRHAATAAELHAGFHKVASGTASITWPQAVDEALCVGWIDGVRRRIDDDRYRIRFTPRKPGSIWSAINIRRVEALSGEGRMQPAGLAAFAQRSERKSSIYSYEQAHTPDLTAADLALFRRNTRAWAYFETIPPGYRKQMLHWVTSAKQAATRERRLAQFIAACAAGQRMR